MKKIALITLSILFMVTGMVLAQDIDLEIKMPGSMYGPGSLFYLDMRVANAGPRLSDVQVFVALTIGTGDYWFYPSWGTYPPNVDWEYFDIAGYATETFSVLPAFVWPDGAGALNGALFLAAMIHESVLVSNLAEFTFGWSEDPQPTPTETPEPSGTPTQPQPTATPVPMEFVYIQPGTYIRGSPETEPCRGFFGVVDETQHQVSLTFGFYIMKTEVTRQMWRDLRREYPVLPYDPSYIDKSPTLDHPVQQTTWYEAVLFANLKSLQDGFSFCYYADVDLTIPIDPTNYSTGYVFCDFDADGYRLPTEGEWEYVVRAGTTGVFSVDEPNYSENTCNTMDPDPPLSAFDSIAWWVGNTGGFYYGTIQPVGTKKPNPWGLYDMHGNVYEWCWDWFGDYPSDPPDGVTDPTGPKGGTHRVLRGGSYEFPAHYCRSASRNYVVSSLRVSSIGFRLVRLSP